MMPREKPYEHHYSIFLLLSGCGYMEHWTVGLWHLSFFFVGLCKTGIEFAILL